MGLFNTVESSLTCPQCHAPVEWQSKRLTYDGFLLDNAMQAVPLSPRIDGEMHGLCDACKTWIDFDLLHGEVVAIRESRPLDDFSKR